MVKSLRDILEFDDEFIDFKVADQAICCRSMLWEIKKLLKLNFDQDLRGSYS